MTIKESHSFPLLAFLELLLLREGLEQIKSIFSIEEALKRYTNDNFMGGVDNVDKDKKLEEPLQRKLCSRSGTIWVY